MFGARAPAGEGGLPQAGVNESSQFFGTAVPRPGSLISTAGHCWPWARAGRKSRVSKTPVRYSSTRDFDGSWSPVATLHSPAPLRFDIRPIAGHEPGRLTLKVDAKAFSPTAWNVTHPCGRVPRGSTPRPLSPRSQVMRQNTRLSRDGNTLVASCKIFLASSSYRDVQAQRQYWSNVSAMQFDSYPTDCPRSTAKRTPWPLRKPQSSRRISSVSDGPARRGCGRQVFRSFLDSPGRRNRSLALNRRQPVGHRLFMGDGRSAGYRRIAS